MVKWRMCKINDKCFLTSVSDEVLKLRPEFPVEKCETINDVLRIYCTKDECKIEGVWSGEGRSLEVKDSWFKGVTVYEIEGMSCEDAKREIEKVREEELSRREKAIEEVEKLFKKFDAVWLRGAEGKHYESLCSKYEIPNVYHKRFMYGNHLFVRCPKDYVIRVPKEIAAHVIGKGGRQIKEISSYCGKRIKVEVV